MYRSWRPKFLPLFSSSLWSIERKMKKKKIIYSHKDGCHYIPADEPLIFIYSMLRESFFGCGRGIPEPLITKKDISPSQHKRRETSAVTTWCGVARRVPFPLLLRARVTLCGRTSQWNIPHAAVWGLLLLVSFFKGRRYKGEGKEVCFWVIMLVHLASRAGTRGGCYTRIDTREQAGSTTPPQRH